MAIKVNVWRWLSEFLNTSLKNREAFKIPYTFV